MNVSNMYIGSPEQNPGGFQLLGSTLLAAPANSISATASAARYRLQIHIYVAGLDASDNCLMTLNSDAGANYFYRIRENNGADTTATAANSAKVDVSATAGARYIILDVVNNAASGKRMILRGVWGGGGAFAPSELEATILWNNTTDQISSIQLAAGGKNFAAGSKISIFGSNDG